MARALENLPQLQQALAQHKLSWSAVRELTRVATPETEEAWCEAGCGKSARELEKLVSGLQPGDKPTDTPSPKVKRHTLRLDVSADTYATFREAVAMLQRICPDLDGEEAALEQMARAVLQGPKDTGRSSYQIAMTVCERCQQGVQHGRGQEVPVAPEIVEMAACDGQFVPMDSGEAGSGETEGDKPKAKQAIPPSVRRGVVRRDGGRCKVPGCRHATFVDVHHLVPGVHEPDRLLVLCGSHHKSYHRGSLLIEGTASTGFSFFHADGTTYGSAAVTPQTAEANRDAFLALKELGFRERAVRQALDAVRARQGPASSLDFQTLMRSGLQKLTGPRHPKTSMVREPQAAYCAIPTWVPAEPLAFVMGGGAPAP